MSSGQLARRTQFESWRTYLTSSDIDVLKEIISTRKNRARNYALIVSVLAFLLSLFMSGLAIYQGYKRDIHDQLAELNVAVRTLQDLNLKIVDTQEKYGGTANAERAMSLITNLMYATTMTAAELIVSVGTNATTASIIPISQNVHQYGQYSRAEMLAEIGLRAAKTYQDETAALKWMARMKFLESSAASKEDGKRLFLRALNFEEKYGAVRALGSTQLNKAGIYLEWAGALAGIDCEEARKQFSEAMAILNAAPRTFDLDRMRSTAQTRMRTGIAPGTGCLPLAEAPVLK